MVNRHVRQALKQTAQRLLSPLPRHLAKNHIKLDAGRLAALRNAIESHYHKGWRSQGNYSREEYESDLEGHLHDGLERNRRTFIPWLDSARRLHGVRILEIGCGTGSSTVALAEQGATVTGVDIDEDSLRVAKDRCDIYGLKVDLLKLSAARVHETFGTGTFDFVIMSASLEHMTSAERLAALKGAWHILSPGGMLAVVDTPNRLWYFDEHTSMLPFYHWLPNDLAFQYSRFSPRENFRGVYTEYNTASKEHFLRRGRGVSFHEFDIAIKPATKLAVVSSLSSFKGVVRKLLAPRSKRKYKALLMAACPGIHEGFFDPSLDIIINR